MAKLAALGGTPVRTTPFPPWPMHDDLERQAILNVLETNDWWSNGGTQVDEFETEWAAFTGAAGAVTTTNGTTALEAALGALGIGQGDEVIIPDWTFMATIGAVLAVNAIPVIVDVDPRTGSMATDDLAEKVTSATRAILPVHLAGSMADMDAIGALARRHDLLVLEDAAHSHGSRWHGKHAGTLGDAGTFSFQASKLMTAGEGGVVISNNAKVLDEARSQINCGRMPDSWYYDHYQYGTNARMTEWQGAVLRCQLTRLAHQQEIRTANADLLNQALPGLSGVQPQARLAGCTVQSNYLYMAIVDSDSFAGVSRDTLRTALLAEGLPVTTGYPPLHRLGMFADKNGLAPRIRDTSYLPKYSSMSFPNTDHLSNSTIWLKTSALLGSATDTQDIVEAFAKVQDCADELAGVEETKY